MSRLKETQQSGRSMLEMMGYMGVVIVIVAGISKLVNNVFGEFRMSEASNQLTELSTAIVQASAIDIDYKDVINAIKNGTAEGKKVIPSSFRVSGSGANQKIYHALGGNVAVGITSDEACSLADTCNKFTITFEGLSREQCIELAMKDWQSNKISDLYAIVINNKYYWYWPIYTAFTASDTIKSLPVVRSAVAGTDSEGECETGRTNSIMWMFN